jgi:rRNA maturation endonuclease Nob1
MSEHLFLCRRCGYIFRPAAEIFVPAGKTPPCPRCGQSTTREMPDWVPAGSALDHAPMEWDYECQGCRKKFKRPVPRSPSEERNITCPTCGGNHIHRLTPAGYEPLYCG